MAIALKRHDVTGHNRPYGTKPCVISSGALWLLISAARSMQLVPGLTQVESNQLIEAIAAGHRALSDNAPRERYTPPFRVDLLDEWERQTA